MDIADYLIETADRCGLVAKEGRRLVARLDAMIAAKTAEPMSQLVAPFLPLLEGGRELSEQVDQIAKSLLAKAVEIDRQREKKGRLIS